MFNHFKEWLLIDHPEIEYFIGKDLTRKGPLLIHIGFICILVKTNYLE